MNLLQLDDYNLTATNETEHDYHLYAERAEPQSFCRSCNLGISLSTLWQDFRGGEEEAESIILSRQV